MPASAACTPVQDRHLILVSDTFAMLEMQSRFSLLRLSVDGWQGDGALVDKAARLEKIVSFESQIRIVHTQRG